MITMYDEESRDWAYKAEYPEMEIRVKYLAKESPAYFIDNTTGEESDCHVIDLEGTNIVLLQNKIFYDRYEKRCEEIGRKGIAAAEIVTDDGIFYVAVG